MMPFGENRSLGVKYLTMCKEAQTVAVISGTFEKNTTNTNVLFLLLFLTP
jgi:chorismate synthase